MRDPAIIPQPLERIQDLIREQFGVDFDRALDIASDILEIAKVDRTKPIRIPRLPWDQFFMLHAHLAATRSTCDRGPDLLFDPGRHGVGCAIVRDNRVIAGGYNGSPPGEPHCSRFRCYVCEAEFGSTDPQFEEFQRATSPITCPCCGSADLDGGHLMVDGHCRRTLHAEENALLQCALDGVSPEGATVYTTASPCWDCAKRLVRVGVRRLVYAAEYGSRYGLSEDAVSLLERAEIEVEHLDVRDVLKGVQ